MITQGVVPGRALGVDPEPLITDPSVVLGHGTIDSANGQHVVVEAARMLVSGGCIGVSTTAILSRRFQAAVHAEGRPLMYGT